jgi:hypothetical protein
MFITSPEPGSPKQYFAAFQVLAVSGRLETALLLQAILSDQSEQCVIDAARLKKAFHQLARRLAPLAKFLRSMLGAAASGEFLGGTTTGGRFEFDAPASQLGRL